ncbi:MAG: histidinol-phosphate transaminase [Planctomycetota bacterium]|jgi:histidinol-phosphate aminotransferase|nr:histidinol-phosphate transaminase [Planctomycetota bacterium]
MTMGIVRACVERMSGYVPGEATEDSRVVKLNQNENRHPPSPRVAEAIAAAAGSLSRYPDSASSSLRRAAAGIYGVEPESVIASNGSDETLLLFFQCCCDPGDEVAGFHPGYGYYATLAAKHDARYRLIDFEGEYRLPTRLDLGHAKLVLLANPNSPTGTLFPEKEIRRLLSSTPHGLVVIDEAYADFSGQSSIPLIREYPNLAVTRTFSKGYALAGLRVGLGFARPELLAQFDKVRDFYNVDSLAQAGAEAALRDREWLESACAKVAAARERTARGLAGLGLKVYDSAANFLLFRCESEAAAEAAQAFLRQRNILVRHFRAPGLSDCLRVSIGTDADMDAFLAALADALKSSCPSEAGRIRRRRKGLLFPGLDTPRRQSDN